MQNSNDACPLTVRPGQVIGLRRARRHEKPGLYPIFAIGGASPEGDGSTAGGDTGASGGDADTATGAGDDAQQGAGSEGQQGGAAGQQQATSGSAGAASSAGKVEDLPDWAQKVIRDARKDAGDARVAAKKATDDFTQKIGKALGLIKDDEKVDPEKLTEQLTAAQAEARLLKIERAAEKAARTHGADVDALLDSRTFAKKLGELDPTADDFATRLDALVKETVDANPKLKATQAAAASGVDTSGGSGETATGGNDVDSMRKLLRPKS